MQQNQGRIYRLINGKDQVPLLPPLDSYWQTYSGMWCVGKTVHSGLYQQKRMRRINDGEILMQERPKEAATLFDSNWVDHKYGGLLIYVALLTPNVARTATTCTASCKTPLTT